MDYLPAPRPTSNPFATVAAVLLALAAGPATIYGAFIGLALHDKFRHSYAIPGHYKVFGLPSAFAAFILGAAITVSILAVLFVLAVRSARPKHRPAPGYAAPTSYAPPKRGANLAIGVSFVFGAVGVAVMLALGFVVFLLIALSQTNLPM
jgi:hypothetical protein